MTLDADQVIDRRRLKRGLVFWRVAAVVAIVAAIVAVVGRGGVPFARDYVARLEVSGFILDDPWRERALADLAGDSRARALLVRIDSPGGTMVGAETLFGALRHVAERMPVVAIMGELSTSAAYFVALGADHIVGRAGTLTGSIGVILQSADITGLLDKLGVKPEIVKSRPLKAQPNPFEPFSPEAREVTRTVILDLHELFVQTVAERRALAPEQVALLADGRIFSGRQAQAHGLIDVLGGEAEARAWLHEVHDIPVTLPTQEVSIGGETRFLDGIVEGVFGKTLFSKRLMLDGLVSLWHPDLL
jgi:protease-4